MGTVEIICHKCKNKSTFDALYLSREKMPENCPKCGEKHDFDFSAERLHNLKE